MGCRLATPPICQWLVVILLSARRCLPYNLEDKLPLFKYGPVDAKFGFSVALHRMTADDSVGLDGTLMVAGAPTASYKRWPGADRLRRAPKKPGGVFYCPVSTDPLQCNRIRMDEGGDIKDASNGITYIRSGQWLGVSVKSQGPSKYLVTCAHRYRQNLGEGEREVERICGKCFLLKANGTGKIEEIPFDSDELPSKFISSPCEQLGNKPNLLNTKLRYGFMQAGASLSIDDDRYVLGAPGTWAWTGGVFDFGFPEAGSVGESMFQSPTCFRKDRVYNKHRSWRCENVPVQRDSYMGLSVATSTAIDTDSDLLFYVAGAPRGNHTGAVVFFSKRLVDGKVWLAPVEANTVFGDKIGSSFGFSLALTDVNGDGLDDLIVGAPQYYEDFGKNKAGGAIYIYLNKPTAEFRNIEPTIIYGPMESFYGHSIAALGDIDQDGFNDFAVGAPYEGENGMVHIFRGGNDGPTESQVIKGSDYSFVKNDFQEIVGFGASLSGSVDADSNKYPDLLIGTFSDSIALFRSRPIITVDAKLEIKETELDLETKSCMRGGRAHTCFDLSFCLSYEARHANYPEGVAIKYILTLDKKRQDRKKSSRLHLDSPRGATMINDTVTLPAAGFKVCPGEERKVFFRNGAEDKLTDVEVKFEFDLDLPEFKREERSDPVFDMIKDPILDADFKKELDSVLLVKNTCGTDGCQSDLKISGEMEEEIIVGQDTTLTINVANDGEEAHQAYLNIYIPPNIDFIQANISEPSLPGMNCFSTASGESSFVRCDLGNPYKNGMKDTIVMDLSTRRLDSRTRTVDVRVEGHTTSQNPKIPPVGLQAQVIVELFVSLKARAEPEQVRYKQRKILGESGMNRTDNIGPLTTYTFHVENLGQLPASGVVLNVDLPIEIENGKWLLYLVTADVNALDGRPAGTCNSTYINILQLEPAVPAASSLSSGNRAKRSARAAPDKVIAEAKASTDGGGFISTLTFACERNNARCVSVQCDLDAIEPEASTTVMFQMNVWEATFLEEFKHVDLAYINAEAQLTTRNEALRFKSGITSAELQTTVDHDSFEEDVISAFPWWYLLIGVIVLLLVYIVIVVALVKCGFFRRKKFPRHHHHDHHAVLEEEDEKREDRL